MSELRRSNKFHGEVKKMIEKKQIERMSPEGLVKELNEFEAETNLAEGHGDIARR